MYFQVSMIPRSTLGVFSLYPRGIGQPVGVWAWVGKHFMKTLLNIAQLIQTTLLL